MPVAILLNLWSIKGEGWNPQDELDSAALLWPSDFLFFSENPTPNACPHVQFYCMGSGGEGGGWASISLPPFPSPPHPQAFQGRPATCLRVHWPHLAGCLAWEGIAAELFGCRSGCWAQEWASRHRDGICFVSWGKEEDSYSFYCEKTRLRQGHIPALGNFKSCFLSPPRICSPTPCRGSLPYVRSPRPVPGIVIVTRIKVTLSVSLTML